MLVKVSSSGLFYSKSQIYLMVEEEVYEKL